MPYTNRVIIHIIVSLVSGVAVAMLLTMSARLRKSRRKEDVFFRFLCIVEIAYCVAVAINHGSSFLVTGHRIQIWTFVMSLLPQILLIFFVQMWVLFVDMSTNKSEDSIKRHYRFAFVPYVILFVLLFLGDGFVKKMQLLPGQNLDDLKKSDVILFVVWMAAYGIVSFVTVIWYVVRAYRIVRYHKRERQRPLFMKLELFIIPWVIVYVLELLPGVTIFLEELCPAISLLLTFFIIQKRYRYLDDKTPFYNSEFVGYLKQFFTKRQSSDGCLMRIRGGGSLEEVSGALSGCQPERSMIFRMDDDSFLMLSHNPGDRGIEAFKSLLTEELKAAGAGDGLNITTYIQEKEESVADFAKRAGI